MPTTKLAAIEEVEAEIARLLTPACEIIVAVEGDRAEADGRGDDAEAIRASQRG